MPSSVIFVFQEHFKLHPPWLLCSAILQMTLFLHTTLIFDAVTILIMCVIKCCTGRKMYTQTI